MPDRVCIHCAALLSRKATRGICKRCHLKQIARDPEVQARRRASCTAANRTSIARARASAMMYEVHRKRANDPDYQQWLRESGRRVGESGLGNACRWARNTAPVIKQTELEIELRKVGLTPFERQMEAVRNGAQIFERYVPARRDYDRTLGGVSDMAA